MVSRRQRHSHQSNASVIATGTQGEAYDTRRTVHVFDAETGDPGWEAEIGYGDDNVTGVEFSPDGRFVAATDGDYVAVLDASTGALLTDLSTSSDMLGNLAWSPDGRRLAVAGQGEILIYTVEPDVQGFAPDRWKAKTLSVPTFVHDVSWAPDGEHVVAGDFDGVARVWNIDSDEPLATFEGSISAWSPDGETIATATGTTLSMHDAGELWSGEPVQAPEPDALRISTRPREEVAQERAEESDRRADLLADLVQEFSRGMMAVDDESEHRRLAVAFAERFGHFVADFPKDDTTSFSQALAIAAGQPGMFPIIRDDVERILEIAASGEEE